jgi:hypothetical protein
MGAMAHRAAGVMTRTAQRDGNADHTLAAIETNPPPFTARDRLRLLARYRPAVDPRHAGKLLRAVAADIESEEFNLGRWRRVDQDRPIAEWRW